MTRRELKPFQIGERVKVYGHLGAFKATVLAVDQTVNSRYGAVSGMLIVENEDGHKWYQHPRQCVRLKPKKPRPEKARAEAWANVYRNGALGLHHSKRAADKCLDEDGRTVRLVELRPGEAIVSRETLAKASEWCDQRKNQIGNKNSWFENLCEYLGLAAGKGK